jgi:SAM-dependent methyltransferase
VVATAPAPPWHEWTTESTQRAIGNVQAAVDRFAPPERPIVVLDAGCGSVRYLDFGPDARVVGIDASEDSLQRDRTLDDRIVGDVEAYPLPDAAYDVVVCWYVFEHLAHPERALVRFARAVRPGGLVVLAIPNVWTPKAMVTKFTPFAAHVAFRRYLLGEASAGTPGCGPFPTTMPLSIAPAPLLGLAAACRLHPVHVERFEDEKQMRVRTMLRLTGWRWRLVEKAVRALSRGRLDATQTELIVVLRRDPEDTPEW